ncbi:NADH-quinone oxidoreductase subunit G [Jongsikchunia kroppenstedtii]|uniref:NADH-quinone oxidoreductase subunit G n=1 Tax=Jongsikchunia kroppenstedtii TaxID=1121721 RepID=UPI00037C652B|nr:NADH-quinone oxidoreductase subunit G [Jongsikchunia kroppenstedtii]
MTTEMDQTADTVDDGLVGITIDGRPVRVAPGTLIIRAAEQVGINIPRFCDHPLLDPVGACRQCIVEVEGQRKPVAACTIPVTDGMVIATQGSSEVAETAQRGVMELLLINHPLDCPICDKGGECPLQNQAMSTGRVESRFTGIKRTFPKPIALSSEVLLDRERCVLCARCTRFADQVAGDPLIELVERGATEQVGIADGHPFDSYFSGNTVQICPVGALTNTEYRFRARPFDLISTPSVCEHCASGCASRTDHRRGQVLRRLAGDDPDVNTEWNCDKGRWAFAYATTDDRLRAPMIRDGDELRTVSWPEAVDVAARGLTAQSTAVLTGGRTTLEDAYAYSKFARVVLGTNDIDFRARDHSIEEGTFLAAMVAGRADVSYADLESAPTVLLVAFEPEEESPIVFLRLRKAVRSGRTAVISMAPLTSRGSEKLDAEMLLTTPGDEPAALESLRGDARLAQPGSVILVGERAAASGGTLSAAAILAAATGARLAWIPRRAGERAAIDAGAHPYLLPAGRPVENATAREQVSQLWGVPLPANPGRDCREILDPVAGEEIGGLLVGGVDPGDLPDPQAALAALAAARFVVSLEQRPTAVTEAADVVLPVAAAAEKSGTYLNWEGRQRGFARALDVPEMMADHRVLSAIADAAERPIGLADVTVLRRELDSLGPWTGDRPGIFGPMNTSRPAPPPGEARLAGWRMLLDNGTLQRGAPDLAGTAHPVQAMIGRALADEIGAQDGNTISVSNSRGRITLPVQIVDMADRTVWLPLRSAGSHVHETLGPAIGTHVAVEVW